MMKKMIRNAIQTPDGTILVSKNGHDYVSHTDKNGFTYATDGGIDYCRRTFDQDATPYTDLSVYIEDGIEKVRENVTWGTYGKNGDEPFRSMKLCEMSNAHIQACLDTQKHMHKNYRLAFEMEIAYRTANIISIID